MAVKVVKIKDSVGASSGGGTDSPSQGIKARVSRGGGGGFNPVGSPEDLTAQKAQEDAARKAEETQQRTAYESRVRANYQQEQDRKESEDNARRAAEARKEYSTTTGRYERGGAIVQETRGKYEDLVRLGKQQPGSKVVQNQSNEYLLIRSTGLNLGSEATLSKLNENIALEGGSQYYPTEKKNEAGGIDYIRRISDSVGVTEPVPSAPETSGGSFADLDPTRRTVYKVNVGSDFISAEQPNDYVIKLNDELGPRQKEPYQKTRVAQPREIAEMISAGELQESFIGPKSIQVKRQEEIALEQQGFKEEVFPITYIDKGGKEIVTITGKGPGTEYQILGKSVPVDLSNLQGGTKPEANKIFPFPLESNPPKPDLVGVAGQTYLNVGLDIVTTLPVMGFGAVKNPISTKLSEYRKETPVDIIFKPERYGEIPAQLSKPEFQVSAIALGSTLVIPTRVPKIPKFAFQSTRSKVSQLETEYLREPGIIGGSEKLGKGTYLIAKGTESKPALVPLTVVKKSPKGKLVAGEITPEPKILYPKEINMQGSLFPTFKTELEAKQIGKYSFKSENPSLEAKQTFRMGVETEGIKPIAEVRYAPVKDILEGKSSELYEYSKSTRGVYAQTRAETKFNPPKNPLVPSEVIYNKNLRSYSPDLADISPTVGAGQAARGFTPQQTETIKDFLKAEAKQTEKPRQDFLGTIQTPQYLQSQEAESLLIQYPKETPEQITRLQGRTVQKESSLQIPKLSTRLEGASLLEQGTKLQTKTIQKTQLRTQQRTELLPRLDIIPRQQTRTKLAQTPRLIQKQAQRFKLITIPDIPIIPKEKIKIPPFIFFALPTERKKTKTQAEKLFETKDYLGNAPQGSIIGLYKRKEITYGDKAIASLLGKERRGGKPKQRKISKTDTMGFPKRQKTKGFSVF